VAVRMARLQSSDIAPTSMTSHYLLPPPFYVTRRHDSVIPLRRNVTSDVIYIRPGAIAVHNGDHCSVFISQPRFDLLTARAPTSILPTCRCLIFL